MYTHAATYASNSEFEQNCQRIKQDGLKWMSGAPNSLRVLDVGCGPGALTKDFLLTDHPAIKEIIAMDISEDMIEFAKKNNSDEKIKYVVADIQDVSTLPTEWIGTFDIIYSSHTLHWVEQQQLGLKNIRSLLADDGEVYFQFSPFIFDFMYEVGDKLLDLWGSFIPKDYEMPAICNRKWKLGSWVSVDDPEKAYTEFMAALGFRVKSIMASKDHQVPNKESFITLYKAVYPPLVFIPKEKHVEFLGNMFDIITNLGYLDDLKQTGGFVTMFVHAKATEKAD